MLFRIGVVKVGSFADVIQFVARRPIDSQFSFLSISTDMRVRGSLMPGVWRASKILRDRRSPVMEKWKVQNPISEASFSLERESPSGRSEISMPRQNHYASTRNSSSMGLVLNLGHLLSLLLSGLVQFTNPDLPHTIQVILIDRLF